MASRGKCCLDPAQIVPSTAGIGDNGEENPALGVPLNLPEGPRPTEGGIAAVSRCRFISQQTSDQAIVALGHRDASRPGREDVARGAGAPVDRAGLESRIYVRYCLVHTVGRSPALTLA